MDGVRWGVHFNDFARRKLIARVSRYAPMPSASLGEFNRIAGVPASLSRRNSARQKDRNATFASSSPPSQPVRSPPPHIRRWFQGLRQPDNPRVSCCGEADAYEADIFEVDGGRYVAIITDGKGEIPNGTKIPVPNHKMKWDEGNPTGHGIIFIGIQGQVYCYVAPGGV